ncbi:hypothetical protein Nepgr_031490 [Nepenthes gracilis]|uniref:Cytochrome P450 n=1 Tax=Nepenthes gracilis TaxID=150966 RepID=A0AAD3THP2_NEPGR|nr:hypothetical protein Nepgr_031490 [Nepenthes gracilis]
MEHRLLAKTCAFATLFALLVYLYRVTWSRRSNHKRQPPVPAGSWPLIGHLRLLASSPLSHIALANLADKYGPIFQIKFGVHPVLVVSSWELAEECLAKNDKVFVNRPRTLAVEQLAYNSAMFGFSPYGPYWRELHALPFLRWLDIGGYEKNMMRTAKQLDGILQGWLEEHKRFHSSEKENGQHDFIDTMLDIPHIVQDKLSSFESNTVIKATCLAMISGGIDTTTTTLTWALSLLLNNPHVLKKALDELDTIVGKERLVNDSDMENLVYLQAIIKETTRLYPAGPLSGPRVAINDCNISGYHVQAGTRLFVNIHKIHRDPRVWPDPYEFRPERFLTTHKHVDVRGQNFELIPFGSGRRICHGISFSFQIMPFTLATLLQAF